jgi:hypothetical protein
MTETITPSKVPGPWEGGNEFAFTVAQRRKYDAMKHTVRRSADLPAEYLVSQIGEPRVGDNHMPRHIRILCPVIGARKDRTKLLVIAPNGTDQWVKWNG